jgi:GTP-binding protein
MFTLAIVGRPNVGKSTLFNRLSGKKLAIIDDTPGVTRDWREATSDSFGQTIRIIDTAGLEEKFDDSIWGRMRKQTESALKEADVILFLVDGKSGLTPMDEHFASYLRKQNIPVILGVNKCENEKATQYAIGEANALGMGNPVVLSSAHGLGISELYEALEEYLPEDEEDDGTGEEESADISEEAMKKLDDLEGREDYDFASEIKHEQDDTEETKPIKLAIIGRPNVGKSTLLNALVKEDRVMTGPEAGITRDAISVDWIYKDKAIKLVDTAGLRKKAKVQEKIEKMAVDDTMRAIRLAQVVVLVLDADLMLEKQDLIIAEHVINEGRALVICVNKWDKIKDKSEALETLQDRLERSLGQIRDIPHVTISALHSKRIERLMEAVLETYELWNTRVPTSGLNRWLAGMESQHPAPLVSGRPNRLKYITQIKDRPPTFALWVSRPKDLPQSYKRYIINGLRKAYSMPGIPIRLLVRTSKNPYK